MSQLPVPHPAPAGLSWSPFWVELPFLVACVAVVVITVVALRRARPEDIPRIFAAFASVLDRLTRRAYQDVPDDVGPVADNQEAAIPGQPAGTELASEGKQQP